MPEVNRSHRTASIWPWALGLFAVLAIGWIAFSFISTDDEVVDNSGEGYDFESVPADVNAFSDFVIMAEDSLQNGLNSKYAKEGIVQLSSAINALVKGNETASEDLRKKNYELSKKAEDISEEEKIEEVDDIKEVLISAAEIMDSLANVVNANIDEDINEIQTVANELDEDGKLRDQDELIMNYFDKANSIIKSLANSENIDSAKL